MPTPQDVVQAFKTQGHFDALRKDLLEAFQSTEQGQALERAILRVLEEEHEAVLAFQSKARLQGQDHMELVRLQSTLRKRLETSGVLSILSSSLSSRSFLGSQTYSDRLEKDIQKTLQQMESERLGIEERSSDVHSTNQSAQSMMMNPSSVESVAQKEDAKALESKERPERVKEDRVERGIETKMDIDSIKEERIQADDVIMNE